MNKSMRVAVFGATGLTGSLVVRKLVERGHLAVAVARTRKEFEGLNSSIEYRTGDMTSEPFVAEAIAGCQAIVFCVGLNRKTRSPWAPQTSPRGLLSNIVRCLLAVVGDDKSKRLIYLSAFGVGEDYPKLSLLHRLVIRTSSLKEAYREHANDEQLLKASSANWTIVKAPGLNDSPKEVGMIDQGTAWSSFSMASRPSLAGFLVHCVEDDSTSRRSMTIAEVKP
jgi:uncharacterized protein YbjT (DUF2867 family)